jgi:hypothetical protein
MRSDLGERSFFAVGELAGGVSAGSLTVRLSVRSGSTGCRKPRVNTRCDGFAIRSQVPRRHRLVVERTRDAAGQHLRAIERPRVRGLTGG